VSKVTPGGTVSLFASGFSTPQGLAVDNSGNLYVVNDNFGNGVVTIARQGNTNGGSPYALRYTAPTFITFAATPEPSSLALLGMAASAMAGYGWWDRRRRRSQPEA
jgi:hypothetical protein